MEASSRSSPRDDIHHNGELVEGANVEGRSHSPLVHGLGSDPLDQGLEDQAEEQAGEGVPLLEPGGADQVFLLEDREGVVVVGAIYPLPDIRILGFDLGEYVTPICHPIPPYVTLKPPYVTMYVTELNVARSTPNVELKREIQDGGHGQEL